MFLAIALAAAISSARSRSDMRPRGGGSMGAQSFSSKAASQTFSSAAHGSQAIGREFSSVDDSTDARGAGRRSDMPCTPGAAGLPPKPRECSHLTQPGVQPPLSSKPCSPKASRR